MNQNNLNLHFQSKTVHSVMDLNEGVKYYLEPTVYKDIYIGTGMAKVWCHDEKPDGDLVEMEVSCVFQRTPEDWLNTYKKLYSFKHYNK